MIKASRHAAHIITKNTRIKLSRRPRPETQPAAGKHAKHVGEVIHAWNAAHAALFGIFIRVGAGGDPVLAHALWHTIQSDKTQRDMVQAAVYVKLTRPLSVLNAVTWGIAALNELSKYRNDSAHTEMMFFRDDSVPGISARRTSMTRLLDNPLDKHWRALRGDLHALASYLIAIDWAIELGLPRPLSRRPLLRLVRSKSAQSQERLRRAKKEARQRQRRSSPE
jgi:hypothetical protein